MLLTLVRSFRRFDPTHRRVKKAPGLTRQPLANGQEKSMGESEDFDEDEDVTV
jgi:hypothetical protein